MQSAQLQTPPAFRSVRQRLPCAPQHLSSPRWTNLEELEALARPRLSEAAYAYYASGAETEAALRDNRAAFARWRLLPRMLRDVSTVDTSTTLFGQRLASPVAIAPMAMQRLCHPDGELAMARGAAAAGVPYILSTMATSSLEQVAGVPECSNRWFQLYVLSRMDVTEQMVRDAERLGYSALVVTVDAPRLGKREADERNRLTLPPELSLKNMERIEAAAGHTEQEGGEGSRFGRHFSGLITPALTWELVKQLKAMTSLPVLGILAPDDARAGVEAGIDGIIVSNHGGRQLDFAPAAVDVLPAVAAAVQGRVPLLVDGGVRRGTDVAKCLALGADAVLLGRPLLWALTLGGQAGVAAALELLRAELELTMALLGLSAQCKTQIASLVGNLGGVTSGLLGLDGGRLATRLSLDALYPVGGFKRCLDTTYGFTFQYPASWLADQRLYLRNIERAERQRTLDPLPPPRPPPPAEGAGGTVRPVPRQAQYEPVAGFGPPGGTGEENVSVIVAPIQPGFRLEAMGSPQDAAAALLARNVAPAGSGLEAALLAADARREGGRLYYEVEFTVRGPAFYRHNLFAYAARGGLLYTLNFQVPERSPRVSGPEHEEDGSAGLPPQSSEQEAGNEREQLEAEEGAPPSEQSIDVEEYEATLPVETPFLAELRAYYRSRGVELQIPRFNRQALDVEKLWTLVSRQGGYDATTSGKLWATVGRAFNPPRSMTNLSLYERTLLAYERHQQGVEITLPTAAPRRRAARRPAPAASGGRSEASAGSDPEGGGDEVGSPPAKRTRLARTRSGSEAPAGATAPEAAGGAQQDQQAAWEQQAPRPASRALFGRPPSRPSSQTGAVARPGSRARARSRAEARGPSQGRAPSPMQMQLEHTPAGSRGKAPSPAPLALQAAVGAAVAAAVAADAAAAAEAEQRGAAAAHAGPASLGLPRLPAAAGAARPGPSTSSRPPDVKWEQQEVLSPRGWVPESEAELQGQELVAVQQLTRLAATEPPAGGDAPPPAGAATRPAGGSSGSRGGFRPPSVAGEGRVVPVQPTTQPLLARMPVPAPPGAQQQQAAGGLTAAALAQLPGQAAGGEPSVLALAQASEAAAEPSVAAFFRHSAALLLRQQLTALAEGAAPKAAAGAAGGAAAPALAAAAAQPEAMIGLLARALLEIRGLQAEVSRLQAELGEATERVVATERASADARRLLQLLFHLAQLGGQGGGAAAGAAAAELAHAAPAAQHQQHQHQQQWPAPVQQAAAGLSVPPPLLGAAWQQQLAQVRQQLAQQQQQQQQQQSVLLPSAMGAGQQGWVRPHHFVTTPTFGALAAAGPRPATLPVQQQAPSFLAPSSQLPPAQHWLASEQNGPSHVIDSGAPPQLHQKEQQQQQQPNSLQPAATEPPTHPGSSVALPSAPAAQLPTPQL
eukprot:scaffold2.g7368.t1